MGIKEEFEAKVKAAVFIPQELVDIMSKCKRWKIKGGCKQLDGHTCREFFRCPIVKEYETQMPRFLGKGLRTLYLPGKVDFSGNSNRMQRWIDGKPI